MKVRVRHRIDRLERDYKQVPDAARRGMRDVVAENIDLGRDLAKSLARQSAGAHGKHYHKAITSEMTGAFEGEFGPDAARPQGGMSFERGSRNQKPHNDLAQAADRMVPSMAADVRKLVTRLFS